MARQTKAPPASTGEALSDSFHATSHLHHNLRSLRAAILISAYHVRPELAVAVAAAAWGGAHG